MRAADGLPAKGQDHKTLYELGQFWMTAIGSGQRNCTRALVYNREVKGPSSNKG